jgi:hypothetical protein
MCKKSWTFGLLFTRMNEKPSIDSIFFLKKMANSQNDHHPSCQNPPNYSSDKMFFSYILLPNFLVNEQNLKSTSYKEHPELGGCSPGIIL